MTQALDNCTTPVVIAIDPHKASWTAAAVDASLRPLATIFGSGQRRRIPKAASIRKALDGRRLGHRGSHRPRCPADQALE
ncbi:hypothetical protein [Rhodococcus sp. USK13]|jgi:hypothetical protein|uniref:hypothetical protein n=1 Tax=Rhodococcus sp. USK13 TaxID=2806442 RepID=UPI002015EFEA|nr:hypothetical protein [Rhodococcus sp. USK13]